MLLSFLQDYRTQVTSLLLLAVFVGYPWVLNGLHAQTPNWGSSGSCSTSSRIETWMVVVFVCARSGRRATSTCSQVPIFRRPRNFRRIDEGISATSYFNHYRTRSNLYCGTGEEQTDLFHIVIQYSIGSPGCTVSRNKRRKTSRSHQLDLPWHGRYSPG